MSEAQLVKELKRIATEAPQKKEEEELYIKKLLEEAHALLQAGFEGAKPSYAAFHYRASFLPEGRQSPCLIGHDIVSRKEIKLFRPAKCPVSDKEWATLFLNSLLPVYLHVFGRSASFSENFALRIEDALRLDTRNWYIPRTARLTISLHEETDANLDTENSSAVAGDRIDDFIYLPWPYYDYLTCHGELVNVLAEAVAWVLWQKNRGGKNWRALRGIGDYRKVEHRLENRWRWDREAVAFSSLQERGIRVALHFILGPEGVWDARAYQAAHSFYERVRADRTGSWEANKSRKELEEDMIYFLRVMQAACIFFSLLGRDSLTVNAFPTFRFELDSEVTSYEDIVKKSYKNLDAFEDNLRMYFRYCDLWSALTVYPSVVVGKSEETRWTRLGLQSLSFMRAPLNIQTKMDSAGPSVYSLYDLPPSTDSYIQGVVGDARRDWPIIALLAADGVRGVRHEGKPVTANIAVGSDVEFRQMLTPIFDVKLNDQPGQVVFKLTDLIDSSEQLKAFQQSFQREMRAFVRRNYSYIQGDYRFICIAISSKREVEFRYIADIRDEFKASRFSVLIDHLLSVSGFTFARVDGSGGIRIVAKSKNHTAGGNESRTIIRRDPNGRWHCPLIPVSRSDMEFHLVRLKELRFSFRIKNDTQRSFVRDVLLPVIEAVSESPTEGATIVLLRKLKDYQGRFLEMPEGSIKVGLEPESNVGFVALETFKRFVVQDGATIVDAHDGEIMPRIQLLGKLLKPQLEAYAASNEFLRKKMPEWGTRHLSVLNFVASIRADTRLRRRDVYCIVVSTDGEVTYFATNTQQAIAQPVLLY